MDLGKLFRTAFLMLKSVDFWLLVAAFGVSGFTLQSLPTIFDQILALVAIFTSCIIISYVFKRRSDWVRKQTGAKGVLSALGVMLFVGYAISAFSVSVAGMRKMELSGTFLEQVQTALAEPMVFGSVIPFIFLGIFSAAGFLGLTDAHQLESQIEA